ncbi:MAG: restriction endonuclease subunit S [Candidatus Cyclobacteriaceae bacterium M2_1C_046]
MEEVVEMKEVKMVPKLRFPRFQDSWKKKRLEELVSHFKSGNGITSQEISEVDKYPVYGGNGLRGFTNSFTHNGSYLLIGRQGALCGNILRVSGEAYVSEHAIVVKTNEENDIDWLTQRLDYFHLNRLSESSAQPGLSVGRLLKLKVYIPHLNEQQKIASFLSSIDKKIQQLIRKKELLEQYKKGVMQKIFKQEIQFKKDNGGAFPEWEEKRLGDIATFSKGKTISKGDLLPDGNVKCILYGELYTRYTEVIEEVVSLTHLNPKDLLLSEVNDLLIPSSGETHIDIARVSCLIKDGIALGGDINVLKTSENGVFLAYYLSSAKKTEIAKLAQGNSVVHLYNKQLKSLRILTPTKEEQEKIADFLIMIDEKIDAVKIQIEKSRQFKKGLLQQMFV